MASFNIRETFARAVLSFKGHIQKKNGFVKLHNSGANLSQEEFDKIIAAEPQIFGGFVRDCLLKMFLKGIDEITLKGDLDIFLSGTNSYTFEASISVLNKLLMQLGFVWKKMENKSRSELYSGIEVTYDCKGEELKVDYIRLPGPLDFDVNGLVFTEWEAGKEPVFKLRRDCPDTMKIAEVISNITKKKFEIVHPLPLKCDSDVVTAFKILIRIVKMKRKGWTLVDKTEFHLSSILHECGGLCNGEIKFLCQEDKIHQFTIEEFIEMYQKQDFSSYGYRHQSPKYKYWTCKCGITTKLPFFK